MAVKEGGRCEARPGFRLAAGVLSSLCFTVGLPVLVYMAIRSSAYHWLDVFTLLVVGAGFASVAYTGRWLCFRKRKPEDGS